MLRGAAEKPSKSSPRHRKVQCVGGQREACQLEDGLDWPGGGQNMAPRP